MYYLEQIWLSVRYHIVSIHRIYICKVCVPLRWLVPVPFSLLTSLLCSALSHLENSVRREYCHGHPVPAGECVMCQLFLMSPFELVGHGEAEAHHEDCRAGYSAGWHHLWRSLTRVREWNVEKWVWCSPQRMIRNILVQLHFLPFKAAWFGSEKC